SPSGATRIVSAIGPILARGAAGSRETPVERRAPRCADNESVAGEGVDVLAQPASRATPNDRPAAVKRTSRFKARIQGECGMTVRGRSGEDDRDDDLIVGESRTADFFAPKSYQSAGCNQLSIRRAPHSVGHTFPRRAIGRALYDDRSHAGFIERMQRRVEPRRVRRRGVRHEYSLNGIAGR